MHLMVNCALDSQRTLEFLLSKTPGLHPGTEVRTTVERVAVLVQVWKVFREIEQISEAFECAKEKLVVVRFGHDAGDPERYLGEEDWPTSRSELPSSIQPADLEVIREGIICLGTIKWYVVKTRSLLSSVGRDKSEVDWFWKSFGEHHHFDAVKLRNRLVHPDEFDWRSSDLKEEITWLSQWLIELAQKIRRTSIAVPDATGAVGSTFRTEEISRLPKVADEEVSAENALVMLTVDHDSASVYPLKFEFISFDSETRTLKAHHGLRMNRIVLH